MCDYSLMSFPSLTREGEELVVHTFPAGAMGLAARSDLHRETISLSVRRDRPSTFLAKLSSRLGLTAKTAPFDSRKPVTAV
jgi:hypothetical protein